MSELKFKQDWNGLLSAALVFLAALVLSMAYQISRMVMAEANDIMSPQGLVFVVFFIGVLASLIGLKKNPKFFSFLAMLNCVGIVIYILLASGLFSIESLIASVALVFLVLGNRRLASE